MPSKIPMRAALLLLPCLLAGPCTVQAETAELAQLRAELERTKALVGELEGRLAAVEARAAEPPPPAAAGSVPAAANAFNPAISAVLQGSYNAYARDPAMAGIAGFPLGDTAGVDGEGFSLGESELNLSANIDPLFYGSLTASLEDDDGETGIELEEAYIETLALPAGLKVRAGRMYPVLGYLNEIHPHADAFVDRPLPYRAFIGADNFGDDGVQVSMTLPTTLFAEFGGGLFRGNGTPAAGAASDGRGAQTLFGRLGGDVGFSHSWLAGVSYLHAEADMRETGDLDFTGDTDLLVVDGKYTWAPNGNLANRSLVVQGEYFWRREDGSYNELPYDESAGGWYAQAVYKFLPRWKLGYRYARLDAPAVPLPLADTGLDSLGHDPSTHSLLLEFDNSEFSSLRLQYTRDRAAPRAYDLAVLRYTVSLGAHGAHKY